jgi:hypothetical protein
VLAFFYLLLPQFLDFLLRTFGIFDFNATNYNSYYTPALSTSNYLSPFRILTNARLINDPRVLAAHAALMITLCALIFLTSTRILTRRGDDMR